MGRVRLQAIARRFPPLEPQVLQLRYELGFTFEQIFYSLQPEFPGLTEARLAEADSLVARHVGAPHRWTLFARRPRVAQCSGSIDSETPPREPTTEDPDPE